MCAGLSWLVQNQSAQKRRPCLRISLSTMNLPGFIPLRNCATTQQYNKNVLRRRRILMIKSCGFMPVASILGLNQWLGCILLLATESKARSHPLVLDSITLGMPFLLTAASVINLRAGAQLNMWKYFLSEELEINSIPPFCLFPISVQYLVFNPQVADHVKPNICVIQCRQWWPREDNQWPQGNGPKRGEWRDDG